MIQELEPKRESLNKELGTIKQKIANITNSIADGGHSRALLQKLNDLESQEMQVRSELVEIEIIAREKPAQIDSEQISELSLALSETINSQNDSQKREILREIIERIEVLRDGKRIQGKIWYHYPGKKKLMSKVSTPLGAPKATVKGGFFILNESPKQTQLFWWLIDLSPGKPDLVRIFHFLKKYLFLR